MRRSGLLVALVALCAAVAGCAGRAAEPDGGPSGGARPVEPSLTRGTQPALGRVYAQAGELLDGGPRAYMDRLEELRGHPVVVNKWASWCGPCRAELPFFRRQARLRGRRIAFLGVNTNDTAPAARRFLDEVPVPFPSYEDPNGDIARAFNGAIAFPSTAFYDRSGRLATVKQGVYESERELAGDIARYAR